MLNFPLFLIGSSLSHFAFYLFRNTIRVYIYLMSNSIVDVGIGYILESIIRVLFSPICGILVDKFNRKYIFVLADFVQFFAFLGIFVYLKHFNMSTSSFFLIVFVYSAINSLLFPINKAIVPEIFFGENLLRATSFEISIERICKGLAFPFVLLVFITKARLEIAILLASILFLASAAIKNFIVFRYAESKKIENRFSIFSVIKSLFLKKDIRKAVLISCFMDMFSAVLLASVIPFILKISNQRSSTELAAYIDSIYIFDKSSFGLILETLIWMFYVLSPFLLSIFFQMLEGTSIEQKFSYMGKRLFKYLHIPASFSFSMWFFYRVFFMKEASCKYAIFSMKSKTIDGSLNMFLMLAMVLGVFITLIFFQLFPWKYNLKKGMKLALYLLVPLSFLISCIVIYFGILEKGDVIQLTFALTPLVIFLTLSTVGYNIFFTSFYQNRIHISELGKFSSFFYVLSILSKTIGILLYKVLINQYALLSIPILFFFFITWNAFSFRNFERD